MFIRAVWEKSKNQIKINENRTIKKKFLEIVCSLYIVMAYKNDLESRRFFLLLLNKVLLT